MLGSLHIICKLLFVFCQKVLKKLNIRYFQRNFIITRHNIFFNHIQLAFK